MKLGGLVIVLGASFVVGWLLAQAVRDAREVQEVEPEIVVLTEVVTEYETITETEYITIIQELPEVCYAAIETYSEIGSSEGDIIGAVGILKDSVDDLQRDAAGGDHPGVTTSQRVILEQKSIIDEAILERTNLTQIAERQVVACERELL